MLTELRQVQESGDAEVACSDVYVVQEPDRPGGGPEGAEGEGAEEGASAEAEAEGAASSEAATDEAESGGCQAAFLDAVAQARQEVSDLQTSIGTIEVEDDRATATVHTELKRQDGSELVQDVPYDLVRTPDGWRVRIAGEG